MFRLRNAGLASLVLLLSVTSCSAQEPWNDVAYDRTGPALLRSLEITHQDGSGSNLIWMDFGESAGGWFVLDTGSAVAIVDDAFAASTGMKKQRDVRVNGLPGSLVSTAQASVGQLHVKNPLFVSIDIDPLLNVDGAGFGDIRVVGVIGYAILKKSVIRIEYDDEDDHIYLYAPDDYALPQGEQWRPAALIDRAPSIRANAAGAVGLFKVDTGKTATASLEADFVRKHELDKDVDLSIEANQRLEGAVDEAVATIDFFEFAGHRFDQPVVSFRLGKEETAAQLDGVIGREFLKAYDLTFDYINARFSITPHEK